MSGIRLERASPGWNEKAILFDENCSVIVYKILVVIFSFSIIFLMCVLKFYRLLEMYKICPETFGTQFFTSSDLLYNILKILLM